MLTPRTTYELVYTFLEEVYSQSKDEYTYDFPLLLSDMRILADGTTADPAQMNDWNSLLPDKEVPLDQVFEFMLAFLEAYRQRGDAGEIAHLLDGLKHHQYQILWNDYLHRFVTETME
jgi:hypothetical protein